MNRSFISNQITALREISMSMRSEVEDELKVDVNAMNKYIRQTRSIIDSIEAEIND